MWRGASRFRSTRTDQIYVHSLEGCVWQGFLARLRTFDWTPADAPPTGARTADLLRRGLRATLWASAHPWLSAGTAAGAAVLLRRRPPGASTAV
jgi:hypothetical protein